MRVTRESVQQAIDEFEQIDDSYILRVFHAYLTLLDERDRLEGEKEELEKESRDLEFFQKLWCEKAGLLLQWPHDEPFQRWFGMVIPQVLDCFRQSVALESQLAALREENELIKKAIQNEPELPGDMPDSIYRLCCGDKKEMEKVLRSVVRATKHNILEKSGATTCD